MARISPKGIKIILSHAVGLRSTVIGPGTVRGHVWPRVRRRGVCPTHVEVNRSANGTNQTNDTNARSGRGGAHMDMAEPMQASIERLSVGATRRVAPTCAVSRMLL